MTQQFSFPSLSTPLEWNRKQGPMNTGFFYQPYAIPARPSLPDYLIVEGAPLLQPFTGQLQHVKGLQMLLFETQELLNAVLQNLSHENNAGEALQYGALDLVSQSMGTELDGDSLAIAHALVQFGYNLWDEFKRLGIYVNGYLHYQHGEWVGQDILLHRLLPDELGLQLPPLTPGEVEQLRQARHWVFAPNTPQVVYMPAPLPATVQPVAQGVYAYDNPANPDHHF